MIVDPDFMDHWRTGMVADAIQDPMAPVYILRLWAHCQERRSDTFVMPTRGLKAQCKAPGDAETFERALIDAGFIERNGDTIIVTGWAEKNAALFAAWENGSKGGRPKKETQSKPMGNPPVTQGKPSANPNETHAEPIREEKRGEELPPTPNGVGCAEPAASAPCIDIEDDGTPACPHTQIIDAYHECLPMARRIRDWTPARASALRTRWREDRRRQSVDWWRRFFGYCAKSEFLTGQTSAAGRKPFEISLDWLVKAENFAKVREGAYHEAAKAEMA